jgi:hypothetical protein
MATDFEANWLFQRQIEAFLAISSGFQSFESLKSQVWLEGSGFQNWTNLYLGT